jgi:ATP adenylyltransferase
MAKMKYLSAPWRWDFIASSGKEKGCVFCRALAEAESDSRVCFRGDKFFVVLNKYPYNSGHLMVAPNAHIASPAGLAAADLLEMGQLTGRSLAILKENFHPDGFNIGMNLGQAAGAGVKDHFHQHIVPRWQGDANFMAVIGDTKVLSYDLATVFATIRSAFAK